MKNIITIFRRDLGSYFTSPVGYIFMIVFLAISVGLYITSFFMFPVADMRGFFGNLPIMLCVFIPAVTMRVWAEDRKENTWEMLLTFPMRARDLVLGKFMAVFVFFGLTLAATFTVPLMLIWLGNPDNGAVFGGYLGTLLLGGFFLSMGLFFSGFCKDQIVAFVVTLLACFLVFLLGTNFIAGYLDGIAPGLGSALGLMLGMIEHYTAFTRGVIEFSDILYFVAWTGLFLFLNALFIEGRNRPGVRFQFGTAIVLCAAIGLAFNWLTANTSIKRFDITEDKIYTVSDASRKILEGIDKPVKVTLYITKKESMPTGMTQLEQDVTAKLDELKIASGGKVDYKTIYLEASNVLSDQPMGAPEEEEEEDESKAIEKRMLDKGIEPFPVEARSGDEVTQKLIYSSIGVGLGAEKEEILPQIMPGTLPELEYKLVNTMYKLTREKAPLVALVAPKEAVSIDPQMRQILMQMGQPVPEQEDPYELLEAVLRYEKYDVQRVELTKDSPLPEEYDTLVVVNPRALDDRQRWEINRALVSGKSVIMAVQNYEWDYRVSREGRHVTRRDENPQVNELLDSYGLGIDEGILMDVTHLPLTVQSSNPLTAMLGGGTSFDFPTHMIIGTESMDAGTSITGRLGPVFYLWGSALDIKEEELKKHGLACRVIMKTSDRAWVADAATGVSQEMFDEPATGQAYPLMAMVTGQFPDAYKDQARPDWPKKQPRPGMPPMPEDDSEEPAAEAVTPAPGKLILLGCSETFRKNFLQQANLDLFLNSVDAVTLGDDLVNVRGRKPIDRMIEKPTDGQKTFWKFVNYASMSIIIAVTGIVTMVLRRRARNAYTMSFAKERS